MTQHLDEAMHQRGLLVHLELKEAVDRMKAEGFSFLEITSGIAAMTNEVIATEYNQATASAWFFGMAKNAANLAAEQMGLGRPGEA